MNNGVNSGRWRVSVGGTEVVVRERSLVFSGSGSVKLIKHEELGGVFVNTNNALGLREDSESHPLRSGL